MTFLSALGVNVGDLLVDHPQHAETWLERLRRQVREELDLQQQAPS